MSGLLAVSRRGLTAAALVAAAVSAAIAIPFGWVPVLAAIAGAIIGATAAAVVVLGARRRGATRLGIFAYVGAAGLLVVLVSGVPVAGYVLAAVLPVLALRMRGRRSARYAGLRSLAK